MTTTMAMLVMVLFALALTNYVALVQEEDGNVSTFFTNQFTDSKWFVASLLVVIITSASLSDMTLNIYAVGILIAISTIYDLKYFIAPNFVNGLIAMIGVSTLLVEHKHLSALQEGLGITMFIFIVWVITHYTTDGAVGGGDFKMLMALSFTLGTNMLFLTVFVACMVVVAITPLLLIGGKNIKELSIPLVPFLLVGYIVSTCFGENIMNWYMGG